MTDPRRASNNGAAKVAAEHRLGRLAPAALVLLGGAIVITASGPLLYRLGALGIEAATQGTNRLAIVFAAAAAVIGAAALVLGGLGRQSRDVILSIAAVTGAALVGLRLYATEAARPEMPPLWDVQTDWSDPVAFSSAVLASRADEGAPQTDDSARMPPGDKAWSGKSFAEIQAALHGSRPATPDEKPVFGIEPVNVNATPADAIQAAEQAAKRMGWKVTLSDKEAGRLEAVATSPWYGFETDVAVRARRASDGSTRVDVRAAAREPAGDMGTVALSVRQLAGDVAFALRGSGPEPATP